MMRIETYSRQPDLMFHTDDFRVGDRFQLGLDGYRLRKSAMAFQFAMLEMSSMHWRPCKPRN
jgi:hypothetical protein